MVNREQASTKRRTRRVLTHVLPLFILGILVAVLLLFVRSALSPAPFREAIVIAGDPVHIISFDTRAKKVTALDLSSDTVIPGALGYGKYAVRAIVSLDEIDHRNGALITGSISNAIGLPIAGYVRMGRVADEPMSASLLSRLFSFGSIRQYMAGEIKGSLSFLSWVRLVFLVHSLSADGIKIINNNAMTNNLPSPDGGTYPELDESRVDYIVDTAFFDGGIRTEALSVAIYNTTTTPAIGTRASRQLAKVGMQMVFVGNQEGDVANCIVASAEEHLRSKTVLFITQTYGCTAKIADDEGKDIGADVVLLLGKGFADRFK
jgi:hypothetical protein